MFYLVIIQKFNNGAENAKAIYEYETPENAMIALYSTMASSMSDPTIASVACIIMNDRGVSLKQDRWDRK